MFMIAIIDSRDARVLSEEAWMSSLVRIRASTLFNIPSHSSPSTYIQVGPLVNETNNIISMFCNPVLDIFGGIRI